MPWASSGTRGYAGWERRIFSRSQKTTKTVDYLLFSPTAQLAFEMSSTVYKDGRSLAEPGTTLVTNLKGGTGMQRIIVAMLIAIGGVSSVAAREPVSLSKVGLSSLRRISDREGSKIRGAASGVSASGLSSLSAIFYDPSTGSRVNFDLVDFSAAIADNGCGARSDAQNYNAIGLTGPLNILFPSGLTASISSFSAGGSSQAVLNGGALTFTVPNPSFNP